MKLIEHATPYDSAERFDRVETELPRLEAECGKRAAEQVRIALDLARKSISTDMAIERYMELRDGVFAPDRISLMAANDVARLTLKNPLYTLQQNDAHREKAIEIARSLGDHHSELILISNWMSARLERRDIAGAKALEKPIEAALDSLPPHEQNLESIIELRSRFSAHRARLHLLDARGNPPEQQQEFLAQARRLYVEAVRLVAKEPHRRVNTQIEWARAWIEHYKDGLLPDTTEAREILEKAYRALDAHDCDRCKAFFHYVQATMFDVQANRRFNEDRRGAAALWRKAHSSLQESTASYVRIKHHFANSNNEYLVSLEEKLLMNAEPPRVFLSHKTCNKPKVREFKALLDELGFAAWLDDDAMPAGAELSPSIREGIESSCGVVFFVTPDFKEEGYIAKEIAYAVEVKQRKGEGFAIIALLWGETTEVPASLRDYVCKRVTSDLEAVREILRSLPVRVGSVFWKKSPIAT